MGGFGSPCTDWSKMGDQLGVEGKTMAAFVVLSFGNNWLTVWFVFAQRHETYQEHLLHMLRCQHLKQNPVEVFIHENVADFPENMLVEAVGCFAVFVS